MNHRSEPSVDQPSFPLFKPAVEKLPEELTRSVSDVLHSEVMRAAMEGPDTESVERQRISLDLDVHTLDALHALGVSLGSTRRAMATKLLVGAVWEAVNDLSRMAHSDGHQDHPEYQAVAELFEAAYLERRHARGTA